MKRISFEVYDEHAPALLAAVEEISDVLATRVEGKFSIPQEAALTRAVAAVTPLRLATARAVAQIADAELRRGRVVPAAADPDYTRER